MTTWNDVEKIRSLDSYCYRLGFVADRDPYDHISGRISLFAKSELMVYDTSSPLASGTVEDLLNFLNGWERAHQYLGVLGAATPKIIERKKLDYRNKHLVKMIKGEDNAKTEA
jgi:hypothetical protein